MSSELILRLICIFFGYHYFWLISFDAGLVNRIYSQSDPKAEPHPQADDPPPFFSWSALTWSGVFAWLLFTSDSMCSLNPSSWTSTEGLHGVAVAALTTKVIFGPSADAHKSFVEQDDGTQHRPWRLYIFDWFTSYPVNLVNTLSHKCGTFAIIYGVIWLFARLGIVEGPNTLQLPLYVSLGWTLLYFGRMSKFFIYARAIEAGIDRQKDFLIEVEQSGSASSEWIARKREEVKRRTVWTYGEKFFAVLSLTAAFFLMYISVEALLRFCGAEPGSLPSITSIAIGVGAFSLFELIVPFTLGLAGILLFRR